MQYKVFVGYNEFGDRLRRPLKIGEFNDFQKATHYAALFWNRAWVERPDGRCFYPQAKECGWLQCGW